MTNGLKTPSTIEAEWEAKMAQLTGLEAKLAALHEEESRIRTELMHLMIQKERIQAAGV